MMVLRLHDWTTSRSCGKFQDFCKSTFRDWNFHETVTDLKHSSTAQTFAFHEAVDPVPNTRLPYTACTLSTRIALLWLLGTCKADWLLGWFYYISFESKKRCPSDKSPCPSKISPARIVSPVATKKRKMRTRLPQVGALRGHGMRCFKVWCHCGVVIYLWWYLKTFDESHRCRLC